MKLTVGTFMQGTKIIPTNTGSTTKLFLMSFGSSSDRKATVWSDDNGRIVGQRSFKPSIRVSDESVLFIGGPHTQKKMPLLPFHPDRGQQTETEKLNPWDCVDSFLGTFPSITSGWLLQRHCLEIWSISMYRATICQGIRYEEMIYLNSISL